MTDEGNTNNLEPDHEDLEAFVPTGIRDQRLVVVGWGASHADHGTPGPHVHLAVEVRLANISLFSLTRAASDARTEMLRELRRQS